jgi:hypothetical protein
VKNEQRRTSRAWLRAGLLSLMVGGAFGACQHETGPSLTFVVEDQRLEPTSSVSSTLCCCRVKGHVRNTSSIVVNINLAFPATDAQNESLGAALDFVEAVQPGELREFDAAGLFAPCPQVRNVTSSHQVTGVFVGSGN